MSKRPWNSDELLIALDLYCRTPYGLFHARNQDIQIVARYINRTPSAVAMKLSNFAALDPVHQTRGIVGLKNTARADAILMNEFLLHPEATILAAGNAFHALGINAEPDPPLLP